MTTIADRAKALQTMLIDRGHEKAGIQLAQRLTEVAWRSKMDLNRVHVAIEIMDSLRKAGVPLRSVDKRSIDLAKKARTRLRSTATRLEAPELDEPAIIQTLDGPTFQEALRDADGMVERLAALVAKALETERSRVLPKTLDETLPDVPGKVAMVAQLSIKRERMRVPVSVTAEALTSERAAVLLAEQADYQAAAAYWEETYPILREALERERPEVRAFLRAAATAEGAKLSLLTAEVWRRLEEDGNLDEFRIHHR
jgi:hypothetical protein